MPTASDLRFLLRTRWLFLILGMGSLGVVLLPLALDLFMAIPWWYRKRMGQAIFLGILGIGLARLWTVRLSDRWPSEEGTETSGGGRFRNAWWLPWALQLATVSFAYPLLRHPDALGFGDWDHHLKMFEAVRQIIANWHQFPWWNPWVRGGFPLAAEPECGAVSLATPLVLLFGTGVGLRLTAVLSLMIAVEGARRLAWHWLREPWAAAAAGLIYGINGGILVYTVAGYFIPMSYCATPWMIYYAFRVGGRFLDGLALGLWIAFDLLSGIQYPSIYGLVVTSLVWLRALRVQPRDRLRPFAVNTLAALGVIFTLAGWRIVTTGLVMLDYPRVWASTLELPPFDALRWLYLRPDATVVGTISSPHFWESTCYIGPFVIAITFASMIQGWRWWHTLTLICFWLSLGQAQIYHASYWLSQAPVFSTMHAVTRWRIVEMLGVGLSVAGLLAHWRREGNRFRQRAAIGAVLIIAADFLLYGHQILPVAGRIRPSEDLFPGPRTASLVNVQDNLGYPAVLRGYGVIRAHEALLGYDRNLPTARLWRGHPQYRGEAWTNDRPLLPKSWSPNRIVFQTEPRGEVHLNLNPGSWWTVNGQEPFARWRCAEWQKPFVVRADAQGHLVLAIKPKGLPLGIALHALGAALLAATIVASRRSSAPGHEHS